MAIKYNNALRTARSMLGKPYSEIDCIRLIVMIIRKSPGGDTSYRCEGTNWLWRSAENAKKYRHIEWRQDGIENARGGMLAFKQEGDDIHHVGFVTNEGTVIHSSSIYGMVVETLLDGSWQLLAGHRDLEIDGKPMTTDIEPEAEVPEADAPENVNAFTSLVRDDGTSIMLAGRWRVAED